MVRGWETTIALFNDEYKLPGLPPEIAAVMASSFELGCSTLLMLGLATRLATLPLLGMIMTIQLFVYPRWRARRDRESGGRRGWTR
jgi:putative oxidoreductase